jgi:hypothetical protein
LRVDVPPHSWHSNALDEVRLDDEALDRRVAG